MHYKICFIISSIFTGNCTQERHLIIRI